MHEVSGKCGGYCCERFCLAYSKEELHAMYLAWTLRARDGAAAHMIKNAELAVRDLRSDYKTFDIHLIYPMLIDLGVHDWNPNKPRKKIRGAKIQHWGCKHFDKKTRLCTIYDIRPTMCRVYPNGCTCTYPGCTLPKEESHGKPGNRKAR